MWNELVAALHVRRGSDHSSSAVLVILRGALDTSEGRIEAVDS